MKKISFVEAIINKVTPKKLRKIKLDKINEKSKI